MEYSVENLDQEQRINSADAGRVARAQPQWAQLCVRERLEAAGMPGKADWGEFFKTSEPAEPPGVELRRGLLLCGADERNEGGAARRDSQSGPVARGNGPQVVHHRQRAGARHVLDDDGRLARKVPAKVRREQLRIGVIAA